MGKIACRNELCGNLRSTTVTSIEGEHIPRCHVCADPPYTLTSVGGEIDRDPMDLLEEFFQGGKKLTVFAGKFYWYDSWDEDYDPLGEDEIKLLKQIMKEASDAG